MTVDRCRFVNKFAISANVAVVGSIVRLYDDRRHQASVVASADQQCACHR